MPIYDYGCPVCDARQPDVLARIDEYPPCPVCGTDMARIWTTRGSSVIGDEMDAVIENNGTPHPIRFRSKAALNAHMHAHGLVAKVRHMPLHQGTDYSPHTTNWGACMDPYTMEAARVLVSRAGALASSETADTRTLPIEHTLRVLPTGIKGTYRDE